MRRLAAALLFALLGSAAHAQVPPYVYAYTVGTAQLQVLPNNAARKRIILINPNATALIAVCPSGNTRSLPSVPVVAKIGGPGCSTIIPYGEVVVDAGNASGPEMDMRAPWIVTRRAARPRWANVPAKDFLRAMAEAST
jgi:hypothetical protein